MDANDPAYAATYPWAAEREDLLTRVRELEAQAAVLAEALQQDSATWYDAQGCCHVCAGYAASHEETCPMRPYADYLANLPQAVQAHLERERALEELAEWVADNVDVESIVFEAEVKPLLAAYRAAGGEG